MAMDDRYPRGRLNAADEGQLTMAVTVRDSTVVVAFGKPVAWFGLGLAEVEGLIALLQKRAEELRRKSA